CGDQRVTYADVLHNVNRCGSALRSRLGVRSEERVLILANDGPAFVYAFFGVIKIGAVAVPLNTLWKPADYAFVVRDSPASVAIGWADPSPQIKGSPGAGRGAPRHVVAIGGSADAAAATHTHTMFGALLAQGSPDLEAEATSRDAPAFWLYSSGSTGTP